MNAVEVQISLKLLKDFLHLPPDVKLTKVSQSYIELQDGYFSLVAEGENLPPISNGNSIPWGRIIIHSDWCNMEECIHITKAEVIVA